MFRTTPATGKPLQSASCLSRDTTFSARREGVVTRRRLDFGAEEAKRRVELVTCARGEVDHDIVQPSPVGKGEQLAISSCFSFPTRGTGLSPVNSATDIALTPSTFTGSSPSLELRTGGRRSR